MPRGHLASATDAGAGPIRHRDHPDQLVNGCCRTRVSGSAQENGVILAVLLVQLDVPAGALYQSSHPEGRNVVLRPPGSDQVAIADAQIGLRRPGRSHRITGQDRPRHNQLSEPGEQPPAAIPGTAEAEVPAEQQDRSPASVLREIVHIAEPNISHAQRRQTSAAPGEASTAVTGSPRCCRYKPARPAPAPRSRTGPCVTSGRIFRSHQSHCSKFRKNHSGCIAGPVRPCRSSKTSSGTSLPSR